MAHILALILSRNAIIIIEWMLLSMNIRPNKRHKHINNKSVITRPGFEFNDAMMVRKTLNGDKNAFGLLVLKYTKRIGNYFYKTGIVNSDIEICIQETFVRAFYELAKLKNPNKFDRWLNKIAKRIFLKQIKQYNNKVRPRFFSIYASDDNDEPSVFLARLTGRSKQPVDILCDKEVKRAIEQCINRLSDKSKEVINLFKDGMDRFEIAAALSINVELADSRLFNAKIKLKPLLERILKEERP